MIRIAGLQMPVTGDIAANARCILDGLAIAAKQRAQILLTPEGSLSGYTSRFDQRELAPAVEQVAARAAELGIALALGTCFWEEGGCCYNQVRVYGMDGCYQGFAAKTLRCAPLDAPESGEIAAYASAPLRTFTIGGVTFGCLICNDLWATPGYSVIPNPYLPWQLHRLGARLILHAVNSGTDLRYRPYHEANLQIWAMSLKMPIATANAAAEAGEPNCRSGVVGPDGQWQHRLDQSGHGCFLCDVAV